ncbi:MAG: RluA family pseudouridine synthase [Myxococcales bacterium]|nr:RluA family pseudouridine synthase [Myxococcales bacterium]
MAAMVPELSRSAAARLVREGQVTVDGVVTRRPSAPVRVGQQLSVDVPPPRPSGVQPQALPLHIVYQDSDLAVIDKEAGRVVHPAPGHPDGTLVNALLHHLDDLSGVGGEERPGIVHRLDRGTSGLLVVAKHDAAHRHLAAQFAAHTAGRTYLAIVHGTPREASGRITSRLARHPRDRLRMASTGTAEGREAITDWSLVAPGEGASLIRCTLQTGRTHQVRVHLRELGHPLLGDGLYALRGRRLRAAVAGLLDPSGQRPMLHAWRLQLAHPADERRLAFVADPPADFVQLLQAFGWELAGA